LTQLENSVEAEEKKWQERLQAKELELQQVCNLINHRYFALLSFELVF
jgi:hypothetical protein